MTNTLLPGARLASQPGPADILLRRFLALAPLSGEEAGLLRELPATTRQHAARSELNPEGVVMPPRILVAGWACRQRLLADGRRQIVSFVLPGDLLDPTLRPRLPSPCAAVALTAAATVDAAPLVRQAERADAANSGIAQAIRLMCGSDVMLLRDHIMRLGRQTAYERMLHLLLELHDRLRTVGLVEGGRFDLPLTQEVLADALGLSIVHVNRTLQQIRREGLVEMKGGSVALLEPELMEVAADWYRQASPPGQEGIRNNRELPSYHGIS